MVQNILTHLLHHIIKFKLSKIIFDKLSCILWLQNY